MDEPKRQRRKEVLLSRFRGGDTGRGKIPTLLYPWRGGNRISLLVDGDRFYSRMLQCIEEAAAYLLLEMYLMESGSVADRFIAALGAAARRGVRVYLLLDDFGTRALAADDRQRLRDAGVRMAFFNPLEYEKWRANLYRDHRKLLLVDGVVAFTGGAGITDRFSPADHPDDYWHDIMVECRGPVVADWRHSFSVVWRECSGEELRLDPVNGEMYHDGVVGRLSTIHPPLQKTKGSLISRMRISQRRIWLVTAYFIPTRKIRSILRRAAKRGIDVRLLVPGSKTDHLAVRRIGQRYYQRLLRNGVRIFEYQPRFLHAKIWLCDDWVSIGSANLDRWTMSWNLEANQEVDSAAFAAVVSAALEDDFANSREISYAQWRDRPWYQRFRESFWSAVATWTQHYSQRRLRIRSWSRKLPEE